MIAFATLLSFILLSMVSIFLIKRNMSLDSINLFSIFKISIIYSFITFIPPQFIFYQDSLSVWVILWYILGTITMTYFEFILTDSFNRKTSLDLNIEGFIMNFEYSIKRSFIIIFFWPIAIFIIAYFNNFEGSNKYKFLID